MTEINQPPGCVWTPEIKRKKECLDKGFYLNVWLWSRNQSSDFLKNITNQMKSPNQPQRKSNLWVPVSTALHIDARKASIVVWEHKCLKYVPPSQMRSPVSLLENLKNSSWSFLFADLHIIYLSDCWSIKPVNLGIRGRKPQLCCGHRTLSKVLNVQDESMVWICRFVNDTLF